MASDEQTGNAGHGARGQRFGQTGRFELGLRWIDDEEPIRRRPAGYGWSMDELWIRVAGVAVTGTRIGDHTESCVRWYLAPVLDWLATNWQALLHEERTPWRRTGAPAAVECRQAFDQWIAATDDYGQRRLAGVQRWYRKHGLRSAAAGGIFPDLFIRRLADEVEFSWSAEPPPFTPDGLNFETGAGFARLAVDEVAEPISEMLHWATANTPSLATPQDNEYVARLRAKVEGTETASDFARAHLGPTVFAKVENALGEAGRLDLFDPTSTPEHRLPYVAELPPAVAMFGGVAPSIGLPDVARLRDALIQSDGGDDCDELAALVRDRHGLPLGIPHQDGEIFAAELLEDLSLPEPEPFTDVHAICERLQIDIHDARLQTDSIRGVAIAGDGFAPKILVNLRHPFNANESGQRFTIAHEFCHVLFDRTRAKRVAHTSGPWANPGIERRANAFAAYLLMPYDKLVAALEPDTAVDYESVERLAATLKVSLSALIEHLYNMDLIDDATRIRLDAARRH